MVISRQAIENAIAGGVTALLVVVGYLLFRAGFSETSDADWLGFSGTILGIMGAALVAIGVPKAQAWSRDRIAHDRIIEAANDLIDALKFEGLTREAAEGRWARVLTARERIQFERERLTHITHGQFIRLRGIERAIENMNDRIVADADLLDPINFEYSLGGDRNALVSWLKELETLLSGQTEIVPKPPVIALHPQD